MGPSPWDFLMVTNDNKKYCGEQDHGEAYQLTAHNVLYAHIIISLYDTQSNKVYCFVDFKLHSANG